VYRAVVVTDVPSDHRNLFPQHCNFFHHSAPHYYYKMSNSWHAVIITIHTISYDVLLLYGVNCNYFRRLVIVVSSRDGCLKE